MNANNPQMRGSGQNFLNRSGSKISVGNKSRVSSGIRGNAGHLSDRSRSDKSDNSQAHRAKDEYDEHREK